jgi:peptidyl-prolyl cis-trans isomerase A (cyclophilin A)
MSKAVVRCTALALACALISAVPAGAARRRRPHTAGGPPVVVLNTSKGSITLQLDPRRAPKTVDNFLGYVRSGHYNGTVFHRVIPDFMIQGGGFDERLRERKTRAPIKHEGKTGLSNVRGTIAMARTSDPDSAAAQFFINVANNSRNLDPPGPDGFGYVVFGRVIKGMDTVDRIRHVRTHEATLHQQPGIAAPAEDVPVKPVVIRSGRVLRGR